MEDSLPRKRKASTIGAPRPTADADSLMEFVRNSLRARVEMRISWPERNIDVQWHRMGSDGCWTRFRYTQARSISEALRAIIQDELADMRRQLR